MLASAFAKIPVTRPQDMAGGPLFYTPGIGEYLGQHMAQAFDMTTTSRALEEREIHAAERAAGTYDADFYAQQEARGLFGTFPDMQPLRHSHAMSEEDWKASPYYRKEIPFRPDMTETRARIMAENFDARRYREELIANGDSQYGLPVKAAAFGAMLLGSLPDPINILPLSGGWRATSMAGKAAANMTRAQAIAAGARAGINTGVIEGAAGAALANAIVLPDLAARGEDVGFVDLMLDVVFGGVLGGGLGALGGGVAGYMGKRRADTLAGLEARAQQELARLEDEDLLTWQEFGTPDNDFLLRADAPEPFTQTPHFLAPDSPLDFFGITRNDDADLVRAGLNGRDKRDIMRAVEKALADMAAGQPVDVGPVLRESHALSRAYDLVRDNPLDGQADDVLAMLEPEDLERVLVHRGPAIERDGEIVVQGGSLRKATGSRSGYGMVKIIFAHGEGGNKRPDMPVVTRDEVLALPQYIREWMPIDDGSSRLWRIPRPDGNLLTIAVRKGSDGPDSRLVSMYVGEGSKTQSTKKPRPESSPAYSGGLGDTGQKLTSSLSGGQNGVPVNNLSPDRPTVNFATERQDGFSPAPPLREGQWAEVPEADATRTLDAELEARLADLAVQGKLDETDMALLHESAERQAMAARYEELGHAALECVLEAE